MYCQEVTVIVVYYIGGVIFLDNSVINITVNDYGKIDVCLKEILDARGLSRYYVAKNTNTRFEVIDKWYANKVERLDLDVLARICYVLDCSPSDIIKYNNK